MKTEQAIELTLEINEYLDSVFAWLNAPSDPQEYQRILKMKEKLTSKIKTEMEDKNQ